MDEIWLTKPRAGGAVCQQGGGVSQVGVPGRQYQMVATVLFIGLLNQLRR